VSDVLVLCYHAVSEDWTAELSVRPDALAEQLETLIRRGYRGATFTDAVSSNPPGARTLAVTFDDAFESVARLALPILARLGLPGTVFVPTDFPDSGRPLAWPGIDHWVGGPHAGELAPLSWARLQALAELGWEVGSHTRSHPRLTQIDDRALADELALSRDACQEHIGRPCVSLAYPYGDVDSRVVRAAREAGYLTGAGLPTGALRTRALEWPRIGIYHPDGGGRFALKVAPTLRRVRALPPFAAALAAARQLDGVRARAADRRGR
jgi:peptidoglycan/xylan/chitin deacetylase (PgdA/CDA1 family)